VQFWTCEDWFLSIDNQDQQAKIAVAVAVAAAAADGDVVSEENQEMS
jgi:tellurite resistance protein